MFEIKSNYYSSDDDYDCCLVHKSMVVEENDMLELYDVTRYVEKTSNKTIKFDVCKFYWEEKVWSYMNRSLDGLFLFVGINHSFSLSPKDYPYLKPDAIYFMPPPTTTDDQYSTTIHEHDYDNDVGIFDYVTQRFSSLYYPRDHHTKKNVVTAASIRSFFFTHNHQGRI